MRPSTSALLAGAAVAGLAFGAVPAATSATPSLEEVPYMSTDLAGDANGINGQGLADIVGLEVPETSTGPASFAPADILGARITTPYDEVIGEDGLTDYVMTAIEFRIAMAAEPAATGAPLVHRFIGETGGCTFWVTVDTGTGLLTHGDASINLFGPGCQIPNDPVTGFEDSQYTSGDWLTYAWDAEMSEMVLTVDLATGDERLTSAIERDAFYIFDEIHNRLVTVPTVPVIDELLTDGFAVIGAEIPADEEPAEEPTPEPAPTAEPTTGGDGATGGSDA